MKGILFKPDMHLAIREGRKMKLEDLTKEELLSIMHRYFFEVPQHHILEARWDSLNKQANEIMTKAQIKLEENIGGGIESIKRFQEASEEFNKGMALSDKAEELWKEMIRVER
jgi:translation initiation factor 2 alpha subunit (eIF-2alpha)